MNKKKLILWGILAVILILLIWLMVYGFTLHDNFETMSNSLNGEFESSTNSSGFVVDKEHKEARLEFAATVTKGWCKIYIYKTGDDPHMGTHDREKAENGEYPLVWSIELKEGDSVDIKEELGELDLGGYCFWVKQSDDLEIRIRHAICYRSSGWQILKKKWLRLTGQE